MVRSICDARCDVVVIGGGFFGLYIADYFSRRGGSVLTVEAGPVPMARASFSNQARVHNGYHYPRSVLTALRARTSFPRFVAEFSDCIVDDYESLYAVGRVLGNLTATQFKRFCDRIGARCDRASGDLKRNFDERLIEEVFSTTEHAFDAVKLRDRMLDRLHDQGAEVWTSTTAQRVERLPENHLAVRLETPEGPRTVAAREVYNCTYAGINTLLRGSDLPTIPLKHELAEMCLMRIPESLKSLGVTVMCGPFFSFLPFPARGSHTLSHVRYTPHCAWLDRDAEGVDPATLLRSPLRRSSWPRMIRDASRYMPSLQDAEYVDSLWEIKTVLPASEANDSRPILLRRNQGLTNLHCVLGAKIDSVYDVVEAIEADRSLATTSGV
ncbi:MAG TPA: FAD-dependent oxidoreductase [Pirellulaceae bacterium]|jgi:glycine/D-amino acid oxidase-like deaminating enzyme|nr:FAD-dependent oxidoreductase [Pirellulaceae bacterium]